MITIFTVNSDCDYDIHGCDYNIHQNTFYLSITIWLLEMLKLSRIYVIMNQKLKSIKLKHNFFNILNGLFENINIEKVAYSCYDKKLLEYYRDI